MAEQLQKIGIQVNGDTVARLLKSMKYSLRVNRKRLESCSKNPPSKETRNQQFENIRDLREGFALEGHALISIEARSENSLVISGTMERLMKRNPKKY
ncbi:MAG: arginine repressor [Verrucomicrobiales bacterium]